MTPQIIGGTINVTFQDQSGKASLPRGSVHGTAFNPFIDATFSFLAFKRLRDNRREKVAIRVFLALNVAAAAAAAAAAVLFLMLRRQMRHPRRTRKRIFCFLLQWPGVRSINHHGLVNYGTDRNGDITCKLVKEKPLWELFHFRVALTALQITLVVYKSTTH